MPDTPRVERSSPDLEVDGDLGAPGDLVPGAVDGVRVEARPGPDLQVDGRPTDGEDDRPGRSHDQDHDEDEGAGATRHPSAGERGVTPGRPATMDSSEAGGLQALAARALSGEQGAVADLLAAVRRLVHRYCRAKLGRLPGADHAAEDAAQEVCIAVLTALPRYKDTGRPFEAFVYRIAANKVADAQRASYRAPVPTDDVPDAATAEPGPEQLALDAFDAETVGRLLDTLPPKLREIITLRVGAGMSAEETGRALGMTAGAVRVAQHRAMQKLRKTALEDASLQVAP
ncbi:RNA polymerase sigma factor ShbA [Kineococcus sp. TBRC 1896]|uniref:RNA polymerase sigma factor ShbA n=1 Tax=Kineococcus mangrovi TaxID=1660183 RepID=A0ABV4I1W5_9ACTN